MTALTAVEWSILALSLFGLATLAGSALWLCRPVRPRDAVGPTGHVRPRRRPPP